MSLSIQLPDNLEQQLSVYCQEHHLSINETVRLALERLLTTNPLLSPYQLGIWCRPKPRRRYCATFQRTAKSTVS